MQKESLSKKENLSKKEILKVNDITKIYRSDSGENIILNHISETFYQNDFTIIMGPSGAGKSTLLYAISGMDSVSGGTVTYNQTDITTLSEKKMAALRSADFGFVFQQANLVSNLTLLENILVPGYMGKRAGKNGADVRQRTMDLLDKMNLTQAKDRLPSECSGGEAQRAAVARAVINKPGILFADEPTGALNRKNTMEVLDLLELVFKEGQSIIMVTHDVKAAIRGNRILYLEDGQIKGEKNLPVYRSSEAKQREEEVSSWLMEMSW